MSTFSLFQKTFLPFLFLFLLACNFVPLVSYAQKEKEVGTFVELVNPIGGSDEDPQGFVKGKKTSEIIQTYIGTTVNKILAVVGSLTLIVFVFGGFMWLTSAGNPDRVQTGTNAMLYSVIGLFIIFGAYVILNTVLKGITGS